VTASLSAPVSANVTVAPPNPSRSVFTESSPIRSYAFCIGL
jgi:hypothetical protein